MGRQHQPWNESNRSPRPTVSHAFTPPSPIRSIGPFTQHALLALFTGVSIWDLVLCGVTFFVRMFAITGGYHRYFSHRTYRTSRVGQFVARLPRHLRDTEGAPSGGRPRTGSITGTRTTRAIRTRPRVSFWHAHQAWILDGEWDDTRLEQVRDLAKCPELVWLNQWHFVAPPAARCPSASGWGDSRGSSGASSFSTTLGWHSTYCINSLAHRWGSVRYETGDDSRNNFWLALLTLGEGWHNNHHHYQSRRAPGFLLVGDRRDVLHPARPTGAGPGSQHQGTAGAPARSRDHPRSARTGGSARGRLIGPLAPVDRR